MRVNLKNFLRYNLFIMSLLLWGLTIGTIGKLILGFAVLRVHLGILHEHKIDGAVLSSIKREQTITMLALALILAGFILEVLFYADFTNFLTCVGTDCTATVQSGLLE